MGTIRDISDQFETPILAFVDNGVQAVSDAVSGPFAAAAALYIVIFGLMITMGYVRSPIFDFIINAFKITFIVFLLKGAAGYTEFVTNIFFTELPDKLGSLLTAAGGSSINPEDLASGAPFDNIVDQGFKIWGEINGQAGSFDVGKKIFAYVILGLIAVVSVLMYAVVLYAKIALALIIAIGPIFIALALFDATRSFTQSWVGSLVNFVVLQVLVYALLGLLISFLNTLITSTSGDDPVGRGVNVLILCVLSLFVTSQLPGVASALAGSGFAIGQGLVGRMAGAATSAARGVGRGTSAAYRGGRSIAARIQSARSNNISKR